MRLALGPENQPYIDLLGRAPGRGVYVLSDRATVLTALGPKGAGRVFKGNARPSGPDEAMRHVEDAVRRLDERLLELIGIGRRAGVLEPGMDAVLRSVETYPEDGGVVIFASDVSDRSRERVEAAIARSPRKVRVVTLANDKVAMGARLGRDEVAVAAMKPSKLAERLVAEADRRAGLAGVGGPRSGSEVN